MARSPFCPPRPVTHERGSRETTTLSKDPRSRADPERAARWSCVCRVPAGWPVPPQRTAGWPLWGPLPPTLSLLRAPSEHELGKRRLRGLPEPLVERGSRAGRPARPGAVGARHVPSGLPAPAAAPPRPSWGPAQLTRTTLSRGHLGPTELLTLSVCRHHRPRKEKGAPVWPHAHPSRAPGCRRGPSRPALHGAARLVCTRLVPGNKDPTSPEQRRQCELAGTPLCPPRTPAPVGRLWVVGT